MKNENDICTVSNTEDIDFNFTEKSQFFIGKHIRCLVRHSIKNGSESWIGVLEWSVGLLNWSLGVEFND